jgi:DNA-binding CsgD family transcriptional regulator
VNARQAKRPIRLRPPRALSAERVQTDAGEEFVLFTWDVKMRADDGALQGLSDAERDVFTRVVAGASNAEIARARSVSPRTVANQVASLLRKLGAGSRFELMRRFGRH